MAWCGSVGVWWCVGRPAGGSRSVMYMHISVLRTVGPVRDGLRELADLDVPGDVLHAEGGDGRLAAEGHALDLDQVRVSDACRCGWGVFLGRGFVGLGLVCCARRRPDAARESAG